MRLLKILFLLFTLVSVAGCSSLAAKDETAGWSAKKLYDEATQALQGKDWEQAIKYYETLQARYPFGVYAKQALLDSAYAYYKYGEPESAIATADRFIKLHPLSPEVAYAYYLKGLANFYRGRDFLDPILPHDPSQGDTDAMRQAFQDFTTIIKKYPQSRYVDDARRRAMYLRNLVAESELNIAHYYMERGAYVAVVNRCSHIVQNFEGSKYVPKALALMVQAYRKLGDDKLAEDTERVLRLNTPQAGSKAATGG
ncbi:MAG: outer membrane protein assembly factor BamD [Gammaproteobacteria bacterium]|jgi:outer membrane protein assembly factor BamD